MNAGGYTIAKVVMVSKGITLLDQTAMFNKDIREWRYKIIELKKWSNYKTFFHQSHCKHRRAFTTAGKGGYTLAVQNIYGVPAPPPEEHHEEVDHINTIFQVMYTQI